MEEKELTLKNGNQYRFVQIWPDYIAAYCRYMEKWNRLTLTFCDWNEVKAWAEKQNYDFEHSNRIFESEPPADYYKDNTRYYGD